MLVVPGFGRNLGAARVYIFGDPSPSNKQTPHLPGTYPDSPLGLKKKNPASCSCATMAADPALRRAAPTPQKPRWRWPRCITSWQSHFTSHFFGSVVCLCAATSLRWRRSLDTHANVRSTFVAFGGVAGVQAAYDSGARIIVRFHGPPHGMVPQEPAGGVFRAGVQRMGG